MWKTIVYKGIEYPYAVSDYGAVVSFHHGKVKFLKLETDKDGYDRITLHFNGKHKHFGVHRLVAMMFLPDENIDGKVVNHKDGDKKNNHVSNLEFIWPWENESHAKLYGLKATGERNFLTKYSDDLVLDIASLIDKGLSAKKISDMTHVPVTYVYQIKYGCVRRNLVSDFNFSQSKSSTTNENSYYGPLIIRMNK